MFNTTISRVFSQPNQLGLDWGDFLPDLDVKNPFDNVFKPVPINPIPTYTGGIVQSNSPSKFDSIWSGSVGLASQIIGALGKRETQQISTGGVKPIGGNYSSSGQNQQYTQQQQQTLSPQQQYVLAQQNSPGNALGKGLDGIVTWTTENPLYVFGAAIAIWLVFLKPPGSKR